jgi:hypothetical protein
MVYVSYVRRTLGRLSDASRAYGAENLESQVRAILADDRTD